MASDRINLSISNKETVEAIEKLRGFYEDSNNGRKLSYVEIVSRAIWYTINNEPLIKNS